jgi:trans-aconitate 2-methyltransferase
MRWDADIYDAVNAPQADAGRELIAMAKVREQDSILDIGCGTGTLTAELARLAHRGKVVGIDPSIEMFDRAKNKCSSFSNILLYNMPAQALHFQKEFDLVFSNSTFQWIKEQEDIMVRVYKALRPDGRFAVQMPAKDFCWAMTENIHSAIITLGLEKKFSRMASPWQFPLKEKMVRFLKDAGFRNVDVFYKDYTLLFQSVDEVLAWGISAALRPYLAPLPERKQERFKYTFAMGFENYRTKKGIEFNFRRLFAFAEKQ